MSTTVMHSLLLFYYYSLVTISSTKLKLASINFVEIFIAFFCTRGRNNSTRMTLAKYSESLGVEKISENVCLLSK